MKYEALQKAAVEASAELQKVVAEMERLEARRLGLLARRESLQVIGHHLLEVMSMIAEATPAATSVEMAAAPELPASEPPALASALPAPEPEPPLAGEAPVLTADAVHDQPAAQWPSIADLLARSKPSSLRDEGWREAAPVAHLQIRALARAAD